ncbi:MAG TPA: MGMT family protein [Candidatus Anoxymicrobiaceae bacterium]
MKREYPTCRIEIGDASFTASATPVGVVSLELPPLDQAVRSLAGRPPVAAKVSPVPEDSRAAANLQALGRFLSQLLAGGTPEEVPEVDIGQASPFTRQVLEVVYRIPWGAVSSYGQVATMAGRPGAARAVGGAVGRNPVALVIPCHRVLAADGRIGGWSGRPGWKEWLLRLESPAAELPPR